MKICVINSLYAPDTRGGAERIVEQSVELLRAAGHEVFVVATKAQVHYEEDGVYRLSSSNLGSFYNYTNKPLWLRLLWLGIDLINPFPALAVKKILKKEQPDVVHTHNMRGLSYRLPRIIKKLGIKHIHTLHDIQYAYPMGLLIKGEEKSFINTFFLRTWYEKFCKALLGNPDVVISPSQWLMDFYVQKGFFAKSQKEILNNPMSLSSDSVKKTSGETMNILFIGQMETHKGVFTLLEAFKQLNQKSSVLNLKLIGPGSQLKNVREVSKDDSRIQVLGGLPNNEVMKHLEESDIFVMPTLTYENQPTVILEAFSRGVPVIASNLGGIPELITEGSTGWLFEAGDSQQLFNKLEQATESIKDSSKRAVLQENCQQKISDFSSDIYLSKSLSIYS